MYARDYVKQILSQHGIFAPAECIKLEEKPPGHCAVIVWLNAYAWVPVGMDDICQRIITHLKVTCGVTVYSVQFTREGARGRDTPVAHYKNPAVSRCES